MADADLIVNLESDNADELVSQGIKAFNLRDFSTAVTALSRAVEVMVEKHGDKHDSLGTAYFYYGKALLEVYREEVEPLGDAVPREIDSDADESSPTDAAKETSPTEPNTSNNEAVDKPPEKSSTVSESGAGEVVTNGQTNNEPVSTSETQDTPTNEEAIEEEPTDLQVAWEVLELAKMIFDNRGDSGKKELAETLILLGEVSLESENFSSAIEDIKLGLDIQKTIIAEEDSREIAETYYKLAVALSTDNQIDEAIEHFNMSLDILKNRISKLKENLEVNNDEIKDMEGLIPEIEEKIADMKNFKEEALKNLISFMQSKPAEPKGPFDAGSSTATTVNDISHLIKRKRKPDDEGDGEDKPPKRASE